MKNVFKKILFFLTSIIIFIVVGATTVAGVKNIIKEIRISNFKNKCKKLNEDEIDSIENIDKLKGKTIFYHCDSNDANSVASALKKILEKTNEIPSSCSISKFKWNEICNKYLSIYKELN